MKRFTIYSDAYQEQYHHFMQYLQTIGYSLASRKTFMPVVREFLGWLEQRTIMSLDQVQESDIEEFYRYQQERPNLLTGGALSEGKIASHMYVIKLLFSYLQDLEQLTLHPMSNLDYKRPVQRRRENLLSLEDIEELYQVCTTAKQRALLGLLYGCGLRRQEAIKLNTADVHFRSGLLYVRQGKGGRKRIIPLSKTVRDHLQAYYYNERSPARHNNPAADSVIAFMLSARGTRMKNTSYRDEMKKLVRAAGLNSQITLHHFRHAIATHLLESGMSVQHVKDFLGHQSLETTQTYTHITSAHMKKTTGYGTTTIPD